MEKRLTFYFDFLSPYAYLAHHKVPQLATRHGFDLDYRVVDLQTLKDLAGNTAPPTRDIPLKLTYARTDMQRWAALYGVPLTPPAGYGSARLNRGAFYAADRDQISEYVAAAYDRVWGKGGDMADETLMAETCRSLGWDAAEVIAFADRPDTMQRYDRDTREAHAKGVFGVPTMMLGDELWWGNDRLDFVEAALREHLED